MICWMNWGTKMQLHYPIDPIEPDIPWLVVALRLFAYGMIACALVAYGLLHL